MKLRRSWAEGLATLLCQIGRVLPELVRAADSRPSAVFGDAERRLGCNLDAAVHCHGFFSGADLLCMQAQKERAGDVKDIVVQVSDFPE